MGVANRLGVVRSLRANWSAAEKESLQLELRQIGTTSASLGRSVTCTCSRALDSYPQATVASMFHATTTMALFGLMGGNAGDA